jgi:hypothetical protein
MSSARCPRGDLDSDDQVTKDPVSARRPQVYAGRQPGLPRSGSASRLGPPGRIGGNRRRPGRTRRLPSARRARPPGSVTSDRPWWRSPDRSVSCALGTRYRGSGAATVRWLRKGTVRNHLPARSGLGHHTWQVEPLQPSRAARADRGQSRLLSDKQTARLVTSQRDGPTGTARVE